jgi:hypothetical protein
MQLPITGSDIISATKSSTTLGTTEPSGMFSVGRYFASAILLSQNADTGVHSNAAARFRPTSQMMLSAVLAWTCHWKFGSSTKNKRP